MHLFKVWMILGFLLGRILTLQAQDHHYSTTHYGLKEGLNTQNIYRSAVSENGQLLLITNRGLTLFDGYRFIHHDSVSFTSPALFLKNNKIYTSNMKGLIELNAFQSLPKVLVPTIQTDSDPNNDHFENIFIDQQKNIWSTDFENVKYFNPITKKVKSFRIHPGNKVIFPHISILQTSKDEIWIFSPKGIWKWNSKNDQIQPLANQEFSKKNYQFALQLQNGTIRLSTAEGEIFEFNPLTESFKKQKSLPENQVVIGMVKNSSGILLLTYNSVYHSSSKGYRLLFQTNSERIQHIHYDEITGNIWLSTTQGLIKLQPENPAFEILNLYNSNAVTKSIAEDEKNQIWTLNSAGEIWKYDGNSSQKVFETGSHYPYGISYSKGNLFLSTQNGIFKQEAGNFVKMNLSGLEIQSEIVKTIITLQNELWVVLASHPIARYTWPGLQKIQTPFANPPEFWSDNKWQDIKVDAKNRIWLVGWMPKSFGITYFNTENQTFTDISNKKINPDRGLFVGDYYTAIGLGKDETMYFSAYGGWNQTDSNGKILKRVNMNTHDIIDSSIRGIAEDSRGNVYFATTEGLHIYRTKLDRVVRLNTMDGLPSNYLIHSFLDLNNRKIAIGTEGGLVLIDKEKALKTSLKNRLEISQILVNDIPRSFTDHLIELSKDERDITIQFSDLSFLPTEKVRFRYRFSDENTWHNLGNKAELSLNYLQPGDYSVLIQALDNLGNAQSKTLQLDIHAKPPFTKSYPFYILLFLVFVGLTLLVNRYFWNRRQKEQNYLRKIKEAEMKTLRSQMNPHFLFNTLNSINSYIVQNKTEDASSYLTTFSKLMRSILENSKKEQISLKNELDTLKLYLELESARLEHSFDYIFKIEDEVDEFDLQVPPLIIQPFAENAIWHGLRNMNERGMLEIRVKQPQEDILCIYIEDNGIGREASQKLKKQETQHKSYGIDITIDRIKTLNQENGFVIHDLYDESGNATGTQIIITLKLKDHD